MKLRLLLIYFILLPFQVIADSNLDLPSCEGFVSWVHKTKENYIKEHQVFPLSEEEIKLVEQYKPVLLINPDGRWPISFDDYLRSSQLLGKEDDEVIDPAPTVESLGELSFDEQCNTYLSSKPVKSTGRPPLYVQVFRDKAPDGTFDDEWLYIRYIPIFEWSGLAENISWMSRMGVYLSGGDPEHWHPLDVHTAVVVAVDDKGNMRTLTLAQHNHMQTYIPGEDFPAVDHVKVVAANRSNELYLDLGSEKPEHHRVVPFYSELEFLIDEDEEPFFWGIDVTRGLKAGGSEVYTDLIFLPPRHPLVDYAGLLGAPNRLMGYFYIGRDGPPGSNYYVPPQIYPYSDFVALGYWKEGDLELLNTMEPFLDGEDTDWEALLKIMRKRISAKLW